MTRAVLLAAAAGALAAPAVVELVVGARVPRPGAPLLARLGRGFGWRPPRGLADRIAAAGLETPAKDVMAIKVGGAVAGLALAAALTPLAPGRTGVLLLAVAPAAAYLAPDALLQQRTRGRARQIEAELADVLDLLRVAVAAGLTPGRALAEVGRRHLGILAAELERAAAHAALGVPRADTYAELNRRARAPGISALVAALERADRHGAPLQPALTAEAATARARRAQRAAEQAARAAPQIQLVVALLLVPAVLLLVAAALLPALVPP
ncbi:MAG TPA: type II secretion system F family protein [Solirubrobacteraceae bacterium]|nr:type II secretion system F family protein [Solirubrobacteraceae bacterium]